MIETLDLKKRYISGKIDVWALKGINLKIDRYEYVAIMGHSGSGKSTLLNILGCLDVPSEGQYKFENEDICNLDDNRLSEIRNRKIGFVFQAFNLLPRLNALANVELPLLYNNIPGKIRLERCEQALEAVGLTHRKHHKPNELSGGQCQRIALARALVNNPSLIFADEPTGNLDTSTGLEIMKIFEKLHERGNTIVLVTHEEYIAKHANRIILLKDGIVENDEKN
ncbi:MAG: ABC transporter ATP-binding protein [Spirochaetales bacterium]|nr:ABC transporter ATP-binding protein [Spirochaetales bacterium]